MKKKEILELFTKFGFLVSDDLISYLEPYNEREVEDILRTYTENYQSDIVIITRDIFKLIEKTLKNSNHNLNWSDIEKSTAMYQKKLDIVNYTKYIDLFEKLFEEKKQENNVEIGSDFSTAYNIYIQENSEEFSLNSLEIENNEFQKIQDDIQEQNSEAKIENNFEINIVEEPKEINKEIPQKTTKESFRENIQIQNLENSNEDNNETQEDEEVIDFAKYLLSKRRNETQYTEKLNFFFDLEKNRLPFDYEHYLASKVNNSFSVNMYYKESVKKLDVQDFTNLFKSRFNIISDMLKSRANLKGNLLTINRLKQFNAKNVAIIGMINNINEKFGNIIINLEDFYDSIEVVVNNNKREIFNIAKNLTLDAVVCFFGSYNNGRFYVDDIMLPDVPIIENSYSDDDVFVFISDVHVGSKQFLEDEFLSFLAWLNQRTSNPLLNEISKKIKAIFIVGDLVDGVGIYSEQNKELTITDIFEQYEQFAQYLKQIPEHIPIIIIPGNHDAVRLAEPQPVIPYYLAKSLWDMKNVVMLSNPSIVEFYDSKNNSLKILLYHGYSFDYYISEIPIVKEKGGYDNISFLMEYLLKLRHLGPSYGSTLYYPDIKDYLVIEQVPHIFASGHVHKVSYNYYNGVHLICSSTWQDRTAFQEKVGHHPEPGKVPIYFAKDKKVKILNFSKNKN